MVRGKPKKKWSSKGGQGLRTQMPHRPVTTSYACICPRAGCRVHPPK